MTENGARSLVQRLAAHLWAYHNDDEPCDGNCEVMALVREADAFLAPPPTGPTSVWTGGFITPQLSTEWRMPDAI